MSRAQDIAAALNAKLKGNYASTGDALGVWTSPRFSTGVLAKDVALGGGVPYGRVVLEVGNKSTSKTTGAFKLLASIENYDHDAKVHYDFVDPKLFVPGVGMYIDAEGTVDPAWLNANGVNLDGHLFIRPQTSIEAFDIICDTVISSEVDLIVLDSLNACAPPEFFDNSLEKNHVGTAARRNNTFFTKLTGCFNAATRNGKVPPTVVIINQFRNKVGVMFGSPETLSGGMGQEFYSSIIVRNGSAPIKGDSSIANAYAECKGKVTKNKTAIPQKDYEYRLCVTHDHPDFPLGAVMTNGKELYDRGVGYGLIVADKGAVTYGNFTTKTQKEMKLALCEDSLLTRTLWRDILYQATGYADGTYNKHDAIASIVASGEEE